MPVLDYVVLAEYVRQDAGTVHIMGAGADTFFLPGVPAAAPAGIAARISFASTEEVGAEHRLNIIFQGADARLLEMVAPFNTPPQLPGVPEHWRTSVGFALRLILPFPQYGDYSLDVIVDDDPQLSKSIDVRAIPVPPGQTPG